MDFSQCQVAGRLAKDVELIVTDKFTKARCAIAFSNGFGDKKRTSFINFEAFGKTAEALKKYCAKGSSVLLAGHFEQSSWMTKDNQRRSDVVIKVREFHFVPSGKPREDVAEDITDDETTHHDNGVPF